ncbi:MAG: DUF3891 family protein, partial [Candidatus Saccharimonadales bacterium]
MIRRTDVDSSHQDRWILVSQVEHARLSGVLAEAWGRPPFAPLEPRDDILAGVRHHDDGWSAWEVAPKVDAQAGRPLDFTEMPMTDSLAIWRESIAAAEKIGPLPGYMVSGHFSALLRRFSSRWASDEAAATLAQGFLDQQAERQAHWIELRRAGGDREACRAEADRAVAWLQMFDALSLWFCCAPRSEPETVEPPGGPALSFRPATSAYQMEVSPWPFVDSRLELTAVGRAIAIAHYANPSDLATAAAEPVT